MLDGVFPDNYPYFIVRSSDKRGYGPLLSRSECTVDDGALPSGMADGSDVLILTKRPQLSFRLIIRKGIRRARRLCHVLMFGTSNDLISGCDYRITLRY